MQGAGYLPGLKGLSTKPLDSRDNVQHLEQVTERNMANEGQMDVAGLQRGLSEDMTSCIQSSILDINYTSIYFI